MRRLGLELLNRKMWIGRHLLTKSTPWGRYIRLYHTPPLRKSRPHWAVSERGLRGVLGVCRSVWTRRIHRSIYLKRPAVANTYKTTHTIYVGVGGTSPVF